MNLHIKALMGLLLIDGWGFKLSGENNLVWEFNYYKKQYLFDEGLKL